MPLILLITYLFAPRPSRAASGPAHAPTRPVEAAPPTGTD
jgi:hypothetical protein